MPQPSECGLGLRARTFIAFSDSRIRSVLCHIPTSQVTASRGTAYFMVWAVTAVSTVGISWCAASLLA
ncbi:hypothetical protein GCM10009642_38630 [Nocardiopsis metallicus]|uniref:Uncharacterized protein n=1 Tax=Nocardiopsis metallicus TaxID=179819 RepID=A0A840W668_9ACTN|nr:hypothetical protein [Nocardiopsis metallicus]